MDRLARVYRGYAESAQVRQRWDQANPGNRAVLRERRRATRDLLASGGWLPLRGRQVLDVGCGSGGELASLTEFGAEPGDLFGVDLLPDRIALAREQFPELHFRVANGESLPFPPDRFDLVMAYTLFSSILDATMVGNVATEITRVLRPGGAVLWYDFRYDNPGNPNVHGMTQGQIGSLFPSLRATLRSITLLPPLARRLGRLTPALYPVLGRVPPLRTHYLGLLVKPGLISP